MNAIQNFVGRYTIGQAKVEEATASGFKESGQILLLTGRPIWVQPQTLAWLEHYGLRRSRTPYGRYENVDARHSR